MGYGEDQDVVELLVSIPCMPSPATYDSVAGCKAVVACKSDPVVRFFDDKLQTLQTQRSAMSSAAAGVVEELGDQGVSFKSLKDVTSGLQLEVDKEVVDMILNSCNKDVWANRELKELVEDYFHMSLSTLNFCGALQDWLRRTRQRQLYIQVALEHMPAEDDPTEGDCQLVVKELEAFAQAPDPFLDDFTQQFEQVYESHVATQNKLRLKKMKLDDRLRAIKGWIKFFNILFGLVSSITTVVATSPEVAEDLDTLETTTTTTTTKPIGNKTTRGSSYCLRPIRNWYARMKATKTIIEVAFRGSYVAIQDLNNIKVSVDRLENEIAAIVRNIRFGDERQHDQFSLQVAVVAIGWKQAAFIKLLTELRETVRSSHNRMSRARQAVLQRIVEYQEYVLKRKPDFLKKEEDDQSSIVFINRKKHLKNFHFL